MFTNGTAKVQSLSLLVFSSCFLLCWQLQLFAQELVAEVFACHPPSPHTTLIKLHHHSLHTLITLNHTLPTPHLSTPSPPSPHTTLIKLHHILTTLHTLITLYHTLPTPTFLHPHHLHHTPPSPHSHTQCNLYLIYFRTIIINVFIYFSRIIILKKSVKDVWVVKCKLQFSVATKPQFCLSATGIVHSQNVKAYLKGVGSDRDQSENSWIIEIGCKEEEGGG